METFLYFNLFSTEISPIDRYNMFLFRDGSKSSSLLNSYDLILIKKKQLKISSYEYLTYLITCKR